jgi:hypothetical protein
MIPLHKHDFLGNIFALFRGAEAKNAARARIGLFIAMGNTHTTTGSDVEALELAVSVNDRDKTNVVGEEVNIVCRRNGNSNLELWECQHSNRIYRART